MQIITAYLIAAALGTLWLGLTAHALFADRSRGRPRCPRCFFDLSGSAQPARCAECGRAITPRSRLHKTHRRWGRAVLAGLILLGPAAGAGALGRVMQTGGWADLPGWVLSRIAWLDQPKLLEELGRRLRRGELSIADGTRVMNHAAGLLKDRRPERVESGLTLIEQAGWQSYVNRTGPTLAALDSGRLAGPLFELVGKPGVTAKASLALSQVRANDPWISVRMFTILPDLPTPSDGVRLLRSSWRPADLNDQYIYISDYIDRCFSLYTRDPRFVVARDEAFLIAKQLQGVMGNRDEVIRLARVWASEPHPKLMIEEPALNDWTQSVDPAYLNSLTPADIDRMNANARTGQLRDRREHHPDRMTSMVRRHMGLWLLALFAPDDPHLTDIMTRLIESSEREDQSFIAGVLIKSLRWSPTLEAMLKKIFAAAPALGDYAIEVAAKFGTIARGIQPDVISWARRPNYEGIHYSLAENWRLIGGEPEPLARALVDRLERLWPEHEYDVYLEVDGGAHTQKPRLDEIEHQYDNVFVDFDLIALRELERPN